MIQEAIVRYFHFLGIITLAASLVLQHILIKPSLSRQEMKKISITDIIYGISALTVFTTGFLLWFTVGKPRAFYTQNMLFMIKITLFFVVALISVYPSIYFFKNRKGNISDIITPPKSIIMAIRLELLLLLVIPFLATLMAKGIGFKGH